MSETTVDVASQLTLEVVQGLIDATWNSHDAEALAAAFAADAVMHVPATGETARGRDEIRQLAERRIRAFPDWHLEVTDVFGAGNRLAAQLVLTGTQEGEFLGVAPTGQRIEVEVCAVFRLNVEGQPEEERIYFDLATMLRQLGQLPGLAV